MQIVGGMGKAEATGAKRRNRRTRRSTPILPSIAAAAGTELAPLIPLACGSRTKLSIPRVVVDLPISEMPEPETFEDVTQELSVLIALDEPRPPRRTTQPPPIPRPPQSAVELVGDWRLGFELGRGGMSTVYAVSHREFGKRAALKLSHESTEGPSLGAKMFLREARIVQLIEHPAMPDVFATGTHEGRPYLVMERLHGETLAELVASGLDRRRAFELLIELCEVLAVAHDAGVTHRDLKLDNVFVLDDQHAPSRKVKLLDWGFAHVAGEDDPFVGLVAGTLGYVAPEQILGTPITPASDLYSLGVLAYRMLLGQSPHEGTSQVDLVRHIHATPTHPAMLWPDIPASLADLLIAMMAKEASCRPSLAEVRAGFAACIARRRRFTRDQVPLARTGKPGVVRRMLGAATAVLCALAGAVAITT